MQSTARIKIQHKRKKAPIARSLFVLRLLPALLEVFAEISSGGIRRTGRVFLRHVLTHAEYNREGWKQ